MKAIILSAGYGTRLHPLSEHTPKPLVPILGKPLLWHTITKLAASKVTWIGINVHHHAEKIKQFVATEKFASAIMLSHEQAILGSGGALNGFKRELEKDSFFILHNGDVLNNIPLEPIIAEWQKHQPLCTLVLINHPRFNNVLLSPDNIIIDLRDRLQIRAQARRFSYTGIAVMHSKILNYVPDGFSDIIDILLDIIRQGKEVITGHVIDGYAWADIGTINDYIQAHKAILSDKIPLIDQHLMPDDPFFIDDNSVIDSNVTFKGFVSIGKNCIVKSSSVIENSIIWDNTVIPENSILKNAIAGKGWQVSLDHEGKAQLPDSAESILG